MKFFLNIAAVALIGTLMGGCTGVPVASMPNEASAQDKEQVPAETETAPTKTITPPPEKTAIGRNRPL